MTMEDGDGLKFRNKEFSGAIDRFYMLIGVVITLVYLFIKSSLPCMQVLSQKIS